jgi:hypothetical protein
MIKVMNVVIGIQVMNRMTSGIGQWSADRRLRSLKRPVGMRRRKRLPITLAASWMNVCAGGVKMAEENRIIISTGMNKNAGSMSRNATSMNYAKKEGTKKQTVQRGI